MLGLTEEQLHKIEQSYEDLPSRLRSYRPLPEECTPEEQICLKFLLAHLPASDWASYSMAFYYKSVRDALSARRTLPWGEKLPPEVFFNEVLPPRINNEDLSDCREAFFLELYPRVRHLSMTEAALEVNYWCLEKASYRSTDIRTNSPLSVVRSAYGRCGEESTLCVAALRSVALPARQCYTPRWAHCDDNHAWVEVWTGTDWNYLGACEPEPVLDRGWFQEPASRGMLIHTRAFSDLVAQSDITVQNPVFTEVNLLSRYAPVKTLRVRVTDAKGAPVSGAFVRFELINYGELYPLATLETDQDGLVRFVTGFGTLSVHASFEGRFCHQVVQACEEELVFCTAAFVEHEVEPICLDMHPPAAASGSEEPLTPDILHQHEERVEQSNQIRKAYMETFLTGEAAAKAAGVFPDFREEIAERLSDSNGNHGEILRFLSEDSALPLHWRVLLLRSLRKKDLADSSCELLNGHLRAALPFRSDYPEELFVSYVLCPWAAFEPLTDYREALSARYSPEQRKAFTENPMELWHYLEEKIEDCTNREYKALTASPVGLLELGYGSRDSRRILFVASCRTLGIPARLNKLDGVAEYWLDGWHPVETRKKDDRSCRLTLTAVGEQTLEYEKSVTLARLENGIYRTLGLDTTGETETEKLVFQLEPGHYRITTANRLQDGTVLGELIPLTLSSGEERTVRVELREPVCSSAMALPLPVLRVRTESGETKEISQLLPQGKRGVLAFLQEGAEPTEHLLNEILEQPEAFSAQREQLLFLLQGETSDPLLKRTLEATSIPCAYRLETGDLDRVLEALSSQNTRLPLVMGLDEGGNCLFHLSGYNVGTGELLLRHLKSGTAE